jgi:hypothetical protein
MNYFNKNIFYLIEFFRKEVVNLYSESSKSSLSLKSKEDYIKVRILQHIRFLTNELIYGFVVKVDFIGNDDYFLFIYDMDKLATNVFYNFDFDQLKKQKDRKIKIEEIFSDDRCTC